jgi:hypothetical protein
MKSAGQIAVRILNALTISMSLWANVWGEVAIDGVGQDIESGLLAYMNFDELPCDAPRWWVERGYRRAHEDIQQAMEAYGHYHAEVDGILYWQDDCWRSDFVIDPGAVMRIKTV